MNLDDLERLARAATPGPWSRFYEGGGDHVIFVTANADQEIAYTSGGCALDPSDSFDNAAADAAFIAAANPAAILRLVEIARAAQEAETALDDLLNDTQHAEHPDCEDGTCPVREARASLAALRSALEGLKGSTP